MQSILSHFLWGAKVSCPCLFKDAWADCCHPKLEGGFGFKDLVKWNGSAVLFQLWRIVNKTYSLWVTWLPTMFLGNKPFKLPSKCPWGLGQILNVRESASGYLPGGFQFSFLVMV